jgi:hypothetical protein
MTSKTPGPKPKFQVVEHTLKCQTYDGEVSLDLRLPFEKLERMSELESVEPQKIPRMVLDEFLRPEEREVVANLTDGAEVFAILLQYANAVGERLGASLGESKRSSDSSGSTDQPSDSTSETASGSPSTS